MRKFAGFLASPLLIAGACAHAQASSDLDAIRALEEAWHDAHSAESIAPILADDFSRPMPSGQIWTRADQLSWLKDRPAPPGMDGRIVQLNVRFYGDVALATGIAAIVDVQGSELDRTVFTDVYAKRAGKWQLVSAQRGPVVKPAAK